MTKLKRSRSVDFVAELNALFKKYGVSRVIMSSDPEGNEMRLLDDVQLAKDTVHLWPGERSD